jgi:hypothetical protein
MTKRIGKAAEAEEAAWLADAWGRAREWHPLAKTKEFSWLRDARELSRVEEGPWKRGQPSRVDVGPWTLKGDAEAPRTE